MSYDQSGIPFADLSSPCLIQRHGDRCDDRASVPNPCKCPCHADPVAFLREPAPEVVEERRPCEVCAPEPCKGHEVLLTMPSFHWKGILR